jgi:hypothetical protein
MSTNRSDASERAHRELRELHKSERELLKELDELAGSPSARGRATNHRLLRNILDDAISLASEDDDYDVSEKARDNFCSLLLDAVDYDRVSYAVTGDRAHDEECDEQLYQIADTLLFAFGWRGPGHHVFDEFLIRKRTSDGEVA